MKNLFTVLTGLVYLSICPVRAQNTTVNVAKTYQTIHGLGVNINPQSWNVNPEAVKKVLDSLVTGLGCTSFRLMYDDCDWEYVNDNNDPNVYNVQIAYNNPGNWENYTRNYPVGNYLVYLRYNDDVAGSSESLNLVTSGYGTPGQTTTTLGQFVSSVTGANYAWLPLTDTGGNKVVVSLPAKDQ